jgi:vancomycin resistance protein VanW
MDLRRVLPYAVRVEVARVRRWPAWVLEWRSIARLRGDVNDSPFVLSAHASPLRRDGQVHDEALQRGKERNVARAAGLLDGLVIAPGQTFSYHHAVGRPSRLRGFVVGLELRDGRPARGVGGGCCQVSNLLYWLALTGGLKITERHRHALDLFPDEGRAVPFGCGATVFYNYADLRFENVLPSPIVLSIRVDGARLHGALLAERDPGWRAEVTEHDHRFRRDGSGGWIRENRIRRRIRTRDGVTLLDEEVAHNVARVLYEPA